MNSWPFVIAAYGLVAVSTILLTAWSWRAMRRAEDAADRVLGR